MQTAKVALVHTADRAAGVSKAVALFAANPVQGKRVLLKPNFNTADPTPGSTHNTTLKQLILELQRMGAASVTIGERSAALTAVVLRDKGIHALAAELGVGVCNFDELPPEDWVLVRPEQSHWQDGFRVPRPLLEAEAVVTTCCLKTHQYGGVFTLSLKLAVGTVPRRGYEYMKELHSSPHQRRMIAELNQAYKPSFIVLDGVEAFVDGGPDKGVRQAGDVILAGDDRIAIDAVGVAILKKLGSNAAIMGSKIFAQEQIARAVELGLGIGSPQQIEIVTGDAASEAYAAEVRAILLEG